MLAGNGISTSEMCFHGAGGKVWPDLVMTVKAYFDDSGDDKKKRFASVGGLVGYQNVWAHFELKWSVATYDLKEPFHATDCECRHGYFKDWTVDQSSSLMKKLTNVVKESRLMLFGSVVPIADYRRVFPDCDPFDPYRLAVKHAIINMAYLGRDLSQDKQFESIGIVHEEGEDEKEFQIYKSLRAVASWPDAKYLKGFTYGSKELNGLQGADLVAREAFKHADNIGKRRTRKPVLALKEHACFHLWTRECLEYLRDKGGPDHLETLTSWGQVGDTVPQMVRLFKDGFNAQ